MRTLALSLFLLPVVGLWGQDNATKVFYYPKPLARTAYRPPMKPVTRIADLKAKHQGEASWRERVIDDGNSLAFMVQEAPGTKHQRRLYPDSPAWWAVLEGRIRFEMEKADGSFETFEATKGSYVFAPERMLHSFEVVGDEPAVRFEVTLYSATPIYDERPAETPAGIEYIPVRLSTGPNPLDVPDLNGEPWDHHVNIYELAKQNANRRRWSRPAMRKNRVRGNFICGQGADPLPEPGNRGHIHSDFAEFWVVMLGELRWTFEGDVENAIVATQGDIIYAPPQTFHLAQFAGEDGLNCRLTSSTFPSANHLYDIEE